MNRILIIIQVIITTLIFHGNSIAQTPNDDKLELMKLELKNELTESLKTDRTLLEGKIQEELAKHRTYMESLNEEIYGNLSRILPVIMGILGFIIAVFLWYVGKSQKEAFETASLGAINKATEIAQIRVNEIIVPEKIIEEVKKITSEIDVEVNKIKESTIKDVSQKLTDTRDEIVENRKEIIKSAIDGELQSRFKDEFNILERIEKLEKMSKKLSEKIDPLLEITLLSLEKDYKRSLNNIEISPTGVIDFTKSVSGFFRYRKFKKDLEKLNEES